MEARLYARPNDVRKRHTEGKSLEGKTATKLEVTARTTATIIIKFEITGKMDVNESHWNLIR